VKKFGTVNKVPLSKANAERLVSDVSDDIGNSLYYPLMQLIAEAFDAIADGEDVYIILGATSNKSAFVCTVKQDGSPTSVYGPSLTDLSLAVQNLL